MKVKLLLIITLCFFIRCTSFKDIERSDRLYLESENMYKLEGIYESATLSPITIYYGEPLNDNGGFLDYVFFTNNLEFIRDTTARYFFEIKPINENKLKINLLDETKVIKSKIIRGEFKDGYFYRRKILIVIPFFPVLGGYYAQRERIGLVNETLVVDIRSNIFMYAIIAGNKQNVQMEARHKKLK